MNKNIFKSSLNLQEKSQAHCPDAFPALTRLQTSTQLLQQRWKWHIPSCSADLSIPCWGKKMTSTNQQQKNPNLF